MNTLNKEKTIVCCFCDTILENGSMFCYKCREYKGIMTLADFEKYYGEFGGY